MTWVIAENHEVLRFGLKAARTTRLIGAPFESALPEMNRWISVAMALRRELAPLPAWATAVASTLIWRPVLRWARTSASKFGGISTTNKSLPWSINGSMSEAVICTGGWKVGSRSPSAIRRDRSEPSSSTMPTERLVASVTAPVATVLTEMLKA